MMVCNPRENGMLLMTNGCSFTQGIYDNFAEYDAWPYKLGKLLGWDVVNLAEGGCSNARIFRTTLEHLLDNTPDYVAVMWTEPARHELPYHTGDTIRVMHSMALPEHDETVTDIPELRNFWYKHCHNELASQQRTVYYIRCIKMILESKNIPYTMGWSFDTDIAESFSNWLCPGSSMQTELSDLPKADSYGHPGTEAHQLWANLMLESVNETLYTAR